MLNPFASRILTKFVNTTINWLLKPHAVVYAEHFLLPRSISDVLEPENSLALINREATSSGVAAIFCLPVELIRKIFSHLKWEKEFLCICKTMTSYLLTSQRLVVCFGFKNFFHRDSTMDPMVILHELKEVIKKIGVHFEVETVDQFELVERIAYQQPSDAFRNLSIDLSMGFFEPAEEKERLLDLLRDKRDFDLIKKITKLQFPQVLNVDNCEKIIQLIISCKSLIYLSFCGVAEGADVKALANLKALEYISWGIVEGRANVQISPSLAALKNLSFYGVEADAIIDIPDSLKALQSLACSFRTNSLPSWQENASFIKKITELALANGRLNADNLERVIRLITRCKSLIHLSLAGVEAGAIIDIPDSFSALESLSFGPIDQGATLILPESLKLLKRLVFWRIEAGAIVFLHESLRILGDNLSFEYVHETATISFYS